jgi:rod shape-determining protein MreD
MKKFLTLSFYILILTILDNTLMPLISIKGYYPSLLFVFIISYSIINDFYEGLWIGVIAGSIQDIFFVNAFGINAFTNMLMCTLAMLIGRSLFKEKTLIPVLSIFVLTFFKGILVYCLFFILKIKTDSFIIIYGSIYNMVMGIFMYRMVYKLCEKKYMIREWTF